MKDESYTRWVEYMKSRRGKWTLDPVHNGKQGMDFLAFCPNRSDASRGVYVSLRRDGSCSSGVYEGAFPHIGEAIFQSRWTKRFPSWEEGISTVNDRLR